MILSEGIQLLSQAKWIWPEDRLYDIRNVYAHFRKDFILEEPVESGVLHITADQSYRLWVNGTYVTRGPARGYQAHWPYDTVDIGRYLKAGHNFIAVIAYNPGVSTYSYISHSSAGFLCAGDFGNVQIRSNADWLSRCDNAYKRDTALYSSQLNFQEHVDGRKVDHAWRTSSKPPKGWRAPGETPFGSMPWHGLEERGIPQLREELRLPVKMVSSAAGNSAGGVRHWRNVTEGLAKSFRDTQWSTINSGMDMAGGKIVLAAPGKGKYRAVVVDMGETVVGPAVIRAENGKSGDILDLFFSERLESDQGPYIPFPAFCNTSMSNRLILADGNTCHEFYQILGSRYVTLVVHESIRDIRIQLEIRDTGYPYTLTGSFECSDKELNDIWNICRRTEQVCSLDSYVDTPWREQAQWWGDARIQFWNTMAIDGDVRLFKRGIRSLAGQKVPNGLTYGHAPTMAHQCILPDFSLVWIITIYDYYRQTGDLSLFVEQLPRIQEVLSYFREEAPKRNGLLSYDPRYWLFLDWSSLAKEGTPTLYNMWYLLALRVLVELFELAGLKRKAFEMLASSEELTASIVEAFFDEEEGLFCDGFDTAGNRRKVHSVHSQTFAVLLGVKEEYHPVMLEKRILPFLRGEALNVPVPSAYWTSYVLTVARMKGFEAEAVDFVRRMWRPMVPFSSCFETFDTKSEIFTVSHAWSAHPVFHLMNLLGGIIQEETNWNSVTFKPYFAPELEFVRIKHPTPHGIIESSWERVGEMVRVQLRLPDGIAAKVRIPGYEGEVTNSMCREIHL
jgi:hypothetical protein